MATDKNRSFNCIEAENTADTANKKTDPKSSCASSAISAREAISNPDTKILTKNSGNKAPSPQSNPKRITTPQKKLEKNCIRSFPFKSAARGRNNVATVPPTRRKKKKSGIRKAANTKSICSLPPKKSTKNRSRRNPRNFDANADPMSNAPPEVSIRFTCFSVRKIHLFARGIKLNTSPIYSEIFRCVFEIPPTFKRLFGGKFFFLTSSLSHF